MYISRVSIKNFRLFDESKKYEIDNYNLDKSHPFYINIMKQNFIRYNDSYVDF